MDEFKSNVVAYVAMDNEIKEHAKRSKDIRERRDALGESIQLYMVSNKIDNCTLPNGGSLALKTQIQMGALNKEYIQETLADFFKKPLPKNTTNLAVDTTDAILSNRETNEKHVLKVMKR